jgi:hypothetical protein
MGSDDDFATLDLLDALVRKSLLVADRSSGRTRFSMLETIRQFAEDQLAAHGEAAGVRAARFCLPISKARRGCGRSSRRPCPRTRICPLTPAARALAMLWATEFGTAR